jgi:hypothetical protein
VDTRYQSPEWLWVGGGSSLLGVYIHRRNVRKQRRVMGWELSRQLRSPGRGSCCCCCSIAWGGLASSGRRRKGSRPMGK